MSEIILSEIEVAIKDPKYLEHQNHAKLVSVANEIVEGKFGEFIEADDSDNFKFPYYEGFFEGKDMGIIFKNNEILWFPQFYILNACLDKMLSQEEIDDWQETDFDWTNEEYERTNSVGIDFKENSFESKFFLSSNSKDFTAIGQFKNDKIYVIIK
jgi:hypothetical protein